MRAALWIALLVAACALAWVVQERWSSGQRAAQDRAYGRAAEPVKELPPGFSRAVLGAPSGAPPAEPPRDAAPPLPGVPEKPEPPPTPAPDAAPRKHLVQSGDSLSKICAHYYGSARPELVNALARANGLADPNALRTGQELVLPSRAELAAPPR